MASRISATSRSTGRGGDAHRQAVETTDGDRHHVSRNHHGLRKQLAPGALPAICDQSGGRDLDHRQRRRDTPYRRRRDRPGRRHNRARGAGVIVLVEDTTGKGLRTVDGLLPKSFGQRRAGSDLARNRKFESISLQRRVINEPGRRRSRSALWATRWSIRCSLGRSRPFSQPADDPGNAVPEIWTGPSVSKLGYLQAALRQADAEDLYQRRTRPSDRGGCS
jgi:hypothetical protein